MNDFLFTLPETNLFFGSGTLLQLGTRAKRHGTKALLVTGKSSMKRLGFLDVAKKSLEDAGIDVVLFEGVEPNPSCQTIDEGTEIGLKNECDMVVAIGGGSAIDAAKVMAVGIGHNDVNAWQYVLCTKETTDKTLPIIAIPSTSGTGSHVTWYTVVTNRDTDEKSAYSSKFIYPKESIVDLDIVAQMPKKVTAETGFDALAHVMEAYISNQQNPITDLLSMRAIKLIGKNLVHAYESGDEEARHAMALADTYAGICITTSRTIMVHGIGNTVSGVYPNITHGQALACLTPPIMRFNIVNGDENTVARYCDIAEALGEEITKTDKQNALKSVDAVIDLLKKIDLSKGFKEFGVDDAGIEKMTDFSLEHGRGAISCNPVEPTREDIIKIYKEAL